ncbi:hypothetical protein Q7P37_000288 [Cladosporium fusiforme]
MQAYVGSSAGRHPIGVAHLLRIGKVQDAQCWWCGESSQTVAHLLLECRKWRRQRDVMLRKLRARNVVISGRRHQADLKTLFADGAIKEVLQFIDDTEVGKKPAGDANKNDSWDIERLDRSADEEDTMLEDERERRGR